MTEGVRVYAGTDFTQAVEASTTDTMLINQNNVVKKVALSQLPISSNTQSALTSIEARITSVNDTINADTSALGSRITSVQAGLVSVNSSLLNQVSISNARITSVAGVARSNLVSLADCSLAVSIGAGGLFVSYDSAQQKFVLASVTGGGGGDITSVNNRVTSVDQYFLNQVSVLDGRITSVQNNVSVVDARVTSVNTDMLNRVSVVDARVTSVRGDITSVQNNVSVVDARVTSVNTYTVNQVSVNTAARTSLQTQINTVSNATSVTDARVTSVNTFFLNQVSVVDVRVTSVNTYAVNQVSVLGARVTSVAGTTGLGALPIVSVNVSVASTVDFVSVFSSSYDIYRVVGQDFISASDGVDLWLRSSSNNGSSYDTGASDYQYNIAGAQSGSGTIQVVRSNGAAQILLANNIGNASGESTNFELTFYNPLGTATARQVGIFSTTRESAAGEGRSLSGAGFRNSNAAINAFRLLFSTGNVTSGVIRIYGERI